MSYNVYLGGQSDLNVNPTSAVPLTVQSRDPNIYDNKNFTLGWHWLNKNNSALWYLASLANGIATWLELSGGFGNVISLQGNSGGRVYPTAGNINVVGDGVTVTVSGTPATSTLTISTLGTGTVEALTGDSGGAVSPVGGTIFVQQGNGNGTSFFLGNANPNTLTLVYSSLAHGNTVLGTSSFLAPMAGAVDNSGLGISVLNAITTGEDNTGVGAFVLENNTTGSRNSALGATALATNVTGDDNVAIGHAVLTNATGGTNTGVGSLALTTITSGQSNTAVGFSALNALTTSGSNVAIGSNSMLLATSAATSVAVGAGSLSGILTGADNVCIGYGAGSSYASSESSNICIGYSVNGTAAESHTLRIGNGTGTGAGQLNAAYIQGIYGMSPSSPQMVIINSAGLLGSTATGGFADSFPTDSGTATPSAGVLNIKAGTATANSGSSVSFSGSGDTVLLNLSDANSNTMLGNLAGTTTLSGSGNIALGVSAGSNLTSTEANNLLIGSPGVTGKSGFAVLQIPSGYRFITTDGVDKFFIGLNAGNTSSTGVNNFVCGSGSLLNVTTATSNQLFGNAIMTTATTAGSGNCCVGGAAFTIGTGNNNLVFGNSALAAGTTASSNVILGNAAGWNSIGNTGITTGTNNILIGYTCGSSYTSSESSNIVIGDTPGVTGESNVLRVGFQGISGGSSVTKAFIDGIRGTTTVNADAIAVLIDSAGQLGTVSSSQRYKANIKDMASVSEDIYNLRPVVFNYKNHSAEDVSVGLIAEEVDEVMPELVVYDKSGEPDTVKYHDLVPMLLNEIQKLHKRVKILENR